MVKLYEICLFVVLLFPGNRLHKIEALLREAKNYEDMKEILPIIKKQRPIYEFIPTISPINGRDKPRYTSKFGFRKDPINGELRMHSGIDIETDYAAYIYATATGKVIFVSTKGGYGKTVIIEHKYGFKTLYGHMSGYNCRKGQMVTKGQIIGFLGNTGRTTGKHIHFEIIKNNVKINPIKFLNHE